MQRLREAQRRGGCVIHEAFKIAKGRAQGGMSKVVEVWDEGEVVGGPAVREAVARQGAVINSAKEAFTDAVSWWAGRVCMGRQQGGQERSKVAECMEGSDLPKVQRAVAFKSQE